MVWHHCFKALVLIFLFLTACLFVAQGLTNFLVNRERANSSQASGEVQKAHSFWYFCKNLCEKRRVFSDVLELSLACLFFCKKMSFVKPSTVAVSHGYQPGINFPCMHVDATPHV